MPKPARTSDSQAGGSGGSSEALKLPLSSLTLVLPAHNEAENLPSVIAEARAMFSTLALVSEIVLVDDGSTDRTGELATGLCQDAGIPLRLIRHESKQGYGATVGDGLRAARGDFVAFTDADGQFDLGEFPMMARLLDTADLVGGYRRQREDAFFRSVVSFVFNTLLRFLYGLKVRDVDCAMKIMRGSFLRSIDLQARSALINAELYWKARRGGWRTAQVAVTHRPRVAGVRSGARPRAILRAVKELFLFRMKLRSWHPDAAARVQEPHHNSGVG